LVAPRMAFRIFWTAPEIRSRASNGTVTFVVAAIIVHLHPAYFLLARRLVSSSATILAARQKKYCRCSSTS
ncbi:hypothetical protein, partial [Paenibacillus odorifer]|uniref:hypothetical protein n=1 Tax=Paenibacillus odorifer TaxID=189426 RepID=UPI001C4C011D